jgi:hypothetical protein
VFNAGSPAGAGNGAKHKTNNRMQNKQSKKKQELLKKSCAQATLGTPSEVFVSPGVEEWTHRGGMACKRMQAIPATVLFRSAADPEVTVSLVGRALCVLYQDCDPTSAELPGGQRKVVRETISIGRLHPGTDATLVPELWVLQYVDDSLLPVFKREILAWWEALSPEQRRCILESFDDGAPLDF